MKYTANDVLQYINEEEIKFIRLAFCDVFGRQKNISIAATELPRAFEYGIAFDASAIAGFGDETHSDLLLRPDPETLMLLPWRPEQGQVVRMFCQIVYPDGRPFECDCRQLLKDAVARAKERGLEFLFGAEQEFYLFKLDERGEPTREPYDRASYMDAAPEDKGEAIRREICLTLEQMGIRPESAHHEEGPGQNEIDFRYSDPITAADNAMTFQTIVKMVAHRNGLYADFSPKPLEGKPGSGFHINLSVRSGAGDDPMPAVIAGLLEHTYDITAFLNPCRESYLRLGSSKAPGYITWSSQNRSQQIRVPAAQGEYRRVEQSSPDPAANPYIAFALLIQAGLDGLRRSLPLPPSADLNLYEASAEQLKAFRRLPASLDEARAAAASSAFVRDHLPPVFLAAYSGS